MENKKLKIGNVPNLRFKAFQGEWELKNLGSLLEFKNGINASKEQYGKGVKFINVLDILNNDFITYDNIVGKVDVDNHTIEKFSVQYGDILFQRSSETREEVGTANVYLDKENTATFGGFVIRGRKIGNYNPIFFNKLLKTNSARDSITSKSGGSTRFNVGQETLSSINLYFPEISEQQKIASFLSLIDERITTQNKIIGELNVLKTTLAKKIFLQQL
ncbi:restriction endonuclease subunit S, partial [Flectobacillus rivi]